MKNLCTNPGIKATAKPKKLSLRLAGILTIFIDLSGFVYN
jgi:hypothetical protein